MSVAKKMHAMAKFGAAKPDGVRLIRKRPEPTHRGPFPVLSEGGRHKVHRDCGGSGCHGCTQTGYETAGAMFLAALETRIGSKASAAEPEPDRKPMQLSMF